jgi:hypothetical protein
MTCRGRHRPTSTELADMMFCEQKVRLKAQLGDCDTPETAERRQAGRQEHDRFHRTVTTFHNRVRAGDTGQDKRCFIATAVYGENDARTEQLRQFRDSALRPYRAGRVLVALYYGVSPHIATRLDRHPWLRRMARRMLDHVRRRIAPPTHSKERCHERDADP